MVTLFHGLLPALASEGAVMAVHVDEIHTDVRQADGAAPSGAAASGAMNHAGDSSGVTIDQRWRESRGHTEWLDRRVAAEDFDD